MIQIKSDIPKIVLARDYLFKVLPEKLEALKLLRELKPFTYTTQSCIEVANKVEDFILNGYTVLLGQKIFYGVINIKGYKTFNPWSSVIGYSDPRNNTIYVNLRKINSLSVEEYAGHILHECCHKIDYGHGNNYPSKKKNFSVPYFLGYYISGKMDLEDLRFNEYQTK
jgi:hypothetical protein